MKSRVTIVFAFIMTMLAAPTKLLADFSFNDFPKFVEDQTPSWIFDVLSTFLIGIFDMLFTALFGVVTGPTVL